MKITVYTAHIGNTDALEEPSYVAPDVQYRCATDQPLTSEVWSPLEAPVGQDSSMRARRFKLTLHETARAMDFYVWQDCRFSLAVDPRIFAPMLMHADLLVMRHPFCGNLVAEVAELKRRRLVDAHRLDAQLKRYREAKFDVDGALHSSTGLLVRRNDGRTRRFNELWLEELERFGHTRDQMSFDYAAWKSGMRIGYLEGEYRRNPWADWRKVA